MVSLSTLDSGSSPSSRESPVPIRSAGFSQNQSLLLLSPGMCAECWDPGSCPQGRNDLQMPKEAQSHYVTHMKHVYKHGWFLAAQCIATHLRRPYLQCLHPKHVLHLPSIIAHSKNRRTQSQCRSFQPGLEQVLQLQAQCKARLT